VIHGGKIDRTVGPGFVMTWPFPYGQIERVSTKPREMEIYDFWMQLDEMELSQGVENIIWRHGGLRPGIDGALFTGDNNLYHVKITVIWKVVDARKFKSNLADPEQTIRDAVCRAAVHVAATLPARTIQADKSSDSDDKENLSMFAMKIQGIVDEDLDDLQSGVKIDSILIPEQTRPIAVLPTFKMAQDELVNKETTISKARADSTEILQKAAGMAFVQLVGDPTDRDTDEPGGLIGKYDRAMESNNQVEADRILAEIDKVLSGGDLTGKARAIIADARAYRSTVEQALAQRTDRFEKLLPRFNSKDPEVRKLLIVNLLASTRKKIMSGKDIEIIKILKDSKNPHVYILPNIPEDKKKDKEKKKE